LYYIGFKFYRPCPRYFLGRGVCLLYDFLALPVLRAPNVIFLTSLDPFAFAIITYFYEYRNTGDPPDARLQEVIIKSNLVPGANPKDEGAVASAGT
jgi:hypothetical protein